MSARPDTVNLLAACNNAYTSCGALLFHMMWRGLRRIAKDLSWDSSLRWWIRAAVARTPPALFRHDADLHIGSVEGLAGPVRPRAEVP